MEMTDEISWTNPRGHKSGIFGLMEFLDSNPDIEKVLVHDFTSVSSRSKDLVGVIQELNTRHVSVEFVSIRLSSLNEDGSINITMTLICEALSQFDKTKNKLNHHRMIAGFEEYIKKGGKIGRVEGFRKKWSDYKTEYSDEVALLRRGVSLRKCHQITKTSINTLRKLKSMFL